MSVREHKGTSLLEFPEDFVVIDLETTGLDPKYDEIIEIAALKVKNGKIIDSFESLANPMCEIDEFITELTGITNEQLEQAPLLNDIFPTALDFIGNSIVIGHNINFDINFLYDKSEELLDKPFQNNYIDTMRLSRNLFPNFNHHRLIDLVERFGISDSVCHRAFSDASDTLKCYEYMKNFAAENSVQFLRDKYKYVSAKDIGKEDGFEDTTSPLWGKCAVFTGKLEKMSRKEAMQTVVNIGGICADSVTKETNFLVLGNLDYCSSIKDGKSSKHKKAEDLILKGYDVCILSENIFYEIVKDFLPDYRPMISVEELTDTEKDIFYLTKSLFAEHAPYFRFERKKSYLIAKCFYPLFSFKMLKGTVYFTCKSIPKDVSVSDFGLEVTSATSSDLGDSRILMHDLANDFKTLSSLMKRVYSEMETNINENQDHFYKKFKSDFSKYLKDPNLLPL